MIGGIFLVCVALALLTLPLQWVGAMIFAAVIHESGHYLAIWLCGGSVDRIQIGLGGAVMSVRGLSPGKELFCAFAGPAFGMIALLFGRWLPRMAMCAAFQTLYNLLPIYPLDGGRILRCSLELKLPVDKVMCIAGWIEKAFIVMAHLLGAYGCFVLRLGLLPLLIPFLLTRYANKYCKSYHDRV